ncbi:MAG: hypothetical protein AB8I08_03170 [Sandaracinaceae bacterium]
MRRLSLLLSRVTARSGLGVLLGCVLAFALADMGCTPDTRRSGSDSGTRLPPVERDGGDETPPPPPPRQDSGGIRLMDSGPPPAHDAGPPPPTPGACRLTGFTQLPVACLPRCSSSTDTALRACEDGDCFTATLQADTTPATSLTLPDGEITTLNCEQCAAQQVQSCWFEMCPTEFQNFFACRDGGGTCTLESDALDACREGSTVISCENTRLAGCFP